MTLSLSLVLASANARSAEAIEWLQNAAATFRRIDDTDGLVTALEPIMLACGGVWVAHGSGSADRDVGERIGVPVDDPAYTLRRVWLTADGKVESANFRPAE